jgi:4-alpha-glucanotransferase
MRICGLTVWQVLPLGPTHEDGSPYQCLSAHAGDPGLISPDLLVEQGWLDAQVWKPEKESWATHHERCLRWAYVRFQERGPVDEGKIFSSFIEQQSYWLEDYSLYQVLRREFEHRPWWEWPVELRDRDHYGLEQARKRLEDEIQFQCFEQFVFFRQWLALKERANAMSILLFGDMPIFVAHDSADVWAHRESFRLDDTGSPIVVSGVPPDYFSETGQRWGNPHYDWQCIQSDGFHWWVRRLRTQLALFDLLRIDHFRGFEAHWEIPAEEETAVNGCWVKAPGDKLFGALQQAFEDLPLVAEDLGVITREVDALRRRYGFPGMRVLQFAFEGGPGNPHLPHNQPTNSVVYTGTHDNDTTKGWFQTRSPQVQAHIREYLGGFSDEMPWPLIRAAFASHARLAVVPMQDLLMLGAEHRMNRPGSSAGNWAWRFSWDQVPEGLGSRVQRLVHIYGRGNGTTDPDETD